MKKITIILLLLFNLQLIGQENQAIAHNYVSFYSLGNGTNLFYNQKKKVEGSEYLFDKWSNNGVVCMNNNENYLLRSINLNLRLNSFASRISKDSIFSFNMDSIKKIIIHKKIYKRYLSKGKGKICQVVFESHDFTLLKKTHVQFIKASPNPMINRPIDKILKREVYFIYNGNNLEKIKLNKKKILKLINPKNVRAIKKYIKSNNFSYSIEKDVVKILIFEGEL